MIPVLSREQMRAFDRHAIEVLPRPGAHPDGERRPERGRHPRPRHARATPASQGRLRLRPRQQRVVLAFLFAIFLAWWLVRRIVGPLRSAVSVFQQIAQGNFRGAVETGRRDEIGQVLDGLESMQTRLGYDVAEAKIVADEMAQIKVGLDPVETNVRIADVNRRVIYANPALLATIRRIEDRIREHAPGFTTETFVGSSIARLYPDPDAALQRLAGLREVTHTQMVIGGRNFDVVTI